MLWKGYTDTLKALAREQPSGQRVLRSRPSLAERLGIDQRLKLLGETKKGRPLLEVSTIALIEAPLEDLAPTPQATPQMKASNVNLRSETIGTPAEIPRPAYALMVTPTRRNTVEFGLKLPGTARREPGTARKEDASKPASKPASTMITTPARTSPAKRSAADAGNDAEGRSPRKRRSSIPTIADSVEKAAATDGGASFASPRSGRKLWKRNTSAVAEVALAIAQSPIGEPNQETMLNGAIDDVTDRIAMLKAAKKAEAEDKEKVHASAANALAADDANCLTDFQRTFQRLRNEGGGGLELAGVVTTVTDTDNATPPPPRALQQKQQQKQKQKQKQKQLERVVEDKENPAAQPATAAPASKAVAVLGVAGEQKKAAPPTSKPFALKRQLTAETFALKRQFGWKPQQNPCCIVCTKAVYALEKLEADGNTYHKKCFRCAHCNNAVSLGGYAALQGKIYCKPHFKQLFKSKGNYNEGFGSEQHKMKWLRNNPADEVEAEC